MLKPFENTKLFGYKEIEEKLLNDFYAGKLHHSLLITGQKGIGKATFAYRLANKILGGKETNATATGLFGETITDTDDLNESNPTFLKIKSGSHPDFMKIEIKIDEKTKKPKTAITIDSIREIKEFLSLTPSISDNRVVIIDSADEMNMDASNAILKILEEPPKNSFLLLISHNPSKLLSTIRSRCNEIKIHPLNYEDWEKALRNALVNSKGYDLEKEDLKTLAKFSDNSIYTAIEMLRNNGLEFYSEFVNLIYSTNIKEIDAFGTKIAGTDFPWWLFDYIANLFITRAIKFKSVGNLDGFFSNAEERVLKRFAEKNSLDEMFEKYEKIKNDISTTARLNLNKKNVVIALVGVLGR